MAEIQNSLPVTRFMHEEMTQESHTNKTMFVGESRSRRDRMIEWNNQYFKSLVACSEGYYDTESLLKYCKYYDN